MRKTLKWSALFVMVCALASIGALAQTTGGAMQGKVMDEAGEPIIGAMIQVTGPALMGMQGASTDTNGMYRVPFLPVGRDFTVKVEAAGYNTVLRKGININLGTTVSLNFELSQGSDVLDVIGSAPVVDTRKTETGATISDTMINSIPLDRDAAGIAYLAPSAVPNVLNVANMGPAIGGASGPENVYIVNGVDVTGGGDALNLTTLNFEFIEATEVKTGGMDAEWGAATGGAINSVTKSGSNEFHGGIFAYYWSDDLGASEDAINNPTVTNYIESQKIWDVGGFLGGYFIKDKLWFFVAYDHNEEDASWTAEGIDDGFWADHDLYFGGSPGAMGYSWARNTGYKNDITNDMYAFKLTFNANPNHRFELSFFGNDEEWDRFRNLNNPGMAASPTIDDTENWALSLHWNATWTPNFFTEAMIARKHTKDSTLPKTAAGMNNWGYYYRFGGGTYAGWQVIPDGLGGYRPSLGGRTWQETTDINDQLRLKATHLFNLGGRHELSYGFQYYDIQYDYNFNYTGPGVVGRATDFYDFTVAGYVDNPWYGRTSGSGAVVRWHYAGWSPTGVAYRAQTFMNNQAKETDQKYYAYWIQDNWNLSDYFMLKLGLRLDKVTMTGGGNSLNVPAQIDPGGTVKGPWANGQPRKVTISDMLAPRIGFTWDVMHNNKSKLYGFWGRYFERMPNDMAIRALTDEYFYFEYFYDAALTQPDNFAYGYGGYPTIISGGPGGGGLKGAYNEESILGFQYEIRPDLSVGIRGIYRNLGRAIEDISMDGGYQYIVTNPDAWSSVWAPDPAGRRHILGHNPDGTPIYGDPYRWRFPKPIRIYKAVELTVDKRFSNNWQLGGSYVLSRLSGNYEGLFSNDNGQLDPNITSKYDLPNLLDNAYGLLPNDRTHNLKLYGGYHFDFGLDVSARFQLTSGTPISKLGADDFYGQDEGFAAKRGTGGRTPTIWWIDLGLQYNFKIGWSNLGVRLDIFNLTNEQRTTRVEQTFNDVDTQPFQTYDYWGYELAHQRARRVRVALRWTF